MPSDDEFWPYLWPLTPNPDAATPDVELADDEDRPENLQEALQLVRDEFGQHDRNALARLTPDQREQQHQAREQMYRLVVTYWEQAKLDGLDLATRPEWQAVAGMLDLTVALVENAGEAQEED